MEITTPNIDLLNNFFTPENKDQSITAATAIALRALKECATVRQASSVDCKYKEINEKLRNAEIKQFNDSCFSWFMNILACFSDKYNTEKIITQNYANFYNEVHTKFLNIDLPDVPTKKINASEQPKHLERKVRARSPDPYDSDNENHGVVIDVPAGMTLFQYTQHLKVHRW